MRRYHPEILIQGYDLADGETLTTHCPACNGGASHDRAFSITRDGSDLKYICFRDKCGIRGLVGGKAYKTNPQHRKVTKAAKLRPYEYGTCQLGTADKQYFKRRFDIDPMQSSLYIRATERGTYLLDVRNPEGKHIGWMERDPVWKGSLKAPRQYDWSYPMGNKAKYWREENEPAVAYYLNSGDFLVVVEDQISALRLSSYGLSTVALLGTHMDYQTAGVLQRTGQQIIIALDADATKTAFKIVREYGMAWRDPKVWILPHDIKDYPIDGGLDIMLELDDIRGTYA